MDKPEWTFWPTQHIQDLLQKQIWSILTKKQKKTITTKTTQKSQTTVWGDHIRSSHCTLWIDTILILNYLPIKVSMRGVWNPSNRIPVSVCAPALWPRAPCNGCTAASGQWTPLPSRMPIMWAAPFPKDSFSLCMHSHMSVSYWDRHTHSSAGVSIMHAQSQPSTLQDRNGSLTSVLLGLHTPRELVHWRHTPMATSQNSLFCMLCNYFGQDAVIAELV